MIGASRLLGVDIMTGHWEFTYGAARVKEAITKELGGIEFLAQNVRTADFGDPVFKLYVMREVNGAQLMSIADAWQKEFRRRVLETFDPSTPALPSMSIGIASRVSEKSTKFEDLIMRADAHLYRAKTAGKGRAEASANLAA